MILYYLFFNLPKMEKVHMKKWLSICLIAILSTGLYAGNGKWSFTTATMFQLSPKTEIVPVSTEGENHFTPITGINIPLAFAQVSARYRIPLDFGDKPIFKGASLSIGLTPILTPINFDNHISITFTPIPLLNLTFGTSLGTAWNFFDYQGLAKFDAETGKYVSLDPFTTWKYSFSLQAGTQFDFGILFPGEWNHIITTLNYSTSYEACTAAEKYEPWSMTGSETVNGFSYSSSVMLGYMMPLKLKMIGFTASFKGRYSGEDFGKYNDNYDGDFVAITLGLQSMIALKQGSAIQVSASFPSRRAFIEKTEKGDVTIDKTAAGREWTFSGITAVWAYTF